MGRPASPTAPRQPTIGDVPARSKVRRRLIIAVLLVLSATLAVVGAVTIWGLGRLGDLQRVSVAGVVPPSDQNVSNWLLVGTDSRSGIDPSAPDAAAFLGEPVPGVRTDTMMIVRVDRRAGSVALLSVPRDLWVSIAGTGSEGRINGAFNGDDGRQRLVATIGDALGLDVNHYVEVDFGGFRQIVDALDGVPVWFEHPTRDRESGLEIVEIGCHVLDGSQALAFARARTFEEFIDGQWLLEPTADVGRTARQRLFLTQVSAAVSDRSLFGKAGLVDDLLAALEQSVVIDDGASNGDLVGLARTLASVEREQIVGHSLPVDDIRTSGGAQVLRLREPEAQTVLDVFRSGAPAAPTVAEPAAEGVPDAMALDDAGQASSAEAPVPEIGESSGYGRFGFTASESPVGTRCG